MLPQNEITAWSQAIQDVGEQTALLHLVEIGEDEVAAQNYLEKSLWHGLCDVLEAEVNLVAKGAPQAEQTVCAVKGPGNPCLWQVLERTGFIAGNSRPADHCIVCVGGNNFQT